MPRDHTPRLLAHLSLGLAGVCLGLAELTFLPEVWLVVPVYLFFIGWSWRLRGRWALPAWLANVLALVIAGGAATWIHFRAGGDELFREVPWPARLIPHLGPVLMALTLVRLYRPRTPGDFWALQALGLLQVALGCVLASGALFGLSLAAYLVVGLCALAAHERQRQQRRSGETAAGPRRRWLGFGLRWSAAAAALALPLFLITPRVEGPEWDPFARFGLQQPPTSARTGFSEQIDLTREGTLEPDDSEAFRVSVKDAAGEPVETLPGDQRWRGGVLDGYDKGIWRGELSWPSGAPAFRYVPYAGEPGGMMLTFRVPRRAGGLFLADPVVPGRDLGALPVRTPNPGGIPPLFFESGGTAVLLGYNANQEYRYTQSYAPRPADRYPAVRLREAYLHKLVRLRADGVEAHTRRLLQEQLTRPPGRYPELEQALALPRTPGWHLPPSTWEPVARRLEVHLSRTGGFGYSTENRRESRDIDPVLDFLSNVRQGTCERYAAALAVMLRSQGIPARVVKGFRGADNLGDGVYVVRQRHAHAWIEALVAVPGKEPLELEWLTLDPTPEAGAVSPGSGWTRWLNAPDLWQDLILGYNAQQQAELWEDLLSGKLLTPALPWLAAAAGLVGVAWLVRRLWRRRQHAGGGGVALLYSRLRALLERHAGLTMTPDATPAELAERARERLAGRGAAEVPALVVELYYRARFGGRAAPAAEVDALARRLDELEGVLRK